MPVILRPDDYDEWTDPEERPVKQLRSVLDRAIIGDLMFYPVTRDVNKAGKDEERFVEPIDNGPETGSTETK